MWYPVDKGKVVLIMKYGKHLIAIFIIGLMCASILACSGDKDKPIYDPDVETGRELSGPGSTYDIGGTAEAPDTTAEDEYVSPYGPKKWDRIQWAPSLQVAMSQAKPGSGKKILLWFTENSCTECREAEEDTFKSEEVLAVAHKYIWVRFDVAANPEKKKEYIQDNNPPALVWLSQDGYSYHKLFGGFDDPVFLASRLVEWH